MSQQDLSHRIAQDVSVAAAKISPPAAAMAFGLTLNEWVAIATLVYLVAQTAYLAWKWLREAKARKAGP